MTNETRNRIIQVFTEHSGYARTQDIRSSGIHHKYLQQLVEEGSIIRLKHGLYSLVEVDNYAVLQEALLTVPDGIICMGTALSFYELTTWNPPETHIAIQRGRKVVLPDYPPIKLYHVSENTLTLGRTEIKVDSGQMIPIYDRERVVCDAVRFRNKIGMDIMKEVLKEYMTSKQKDLNTLYSYARKLRIATVLNQYLDVLL
ncbi:MULTISPECIES: type IV toxin-antitoxin system AbiEi family antitoxin domain-containing protein [unclassified Oceanispirochaeta]|nr:MULTISPECIES: type IV toxin-antitoxin system AbiEi family antitoxin domain-containing protein [unclassified Oceanispirochaeta]MBF9014689.1 type IV toxin-antitoxin system AbiEi family antitoxin domain-containing protein [Oceanispirochaeta sp. M2]NPD70945.1 Abortive infection protein AbiEi [Oceanispirochaeta sp. M1]